MGDDDNKDFYKQKHGINIALASQLRLHDILNRIVNLDAGYPIDSPEKQKCFSQFNRLEIKRSLVLKLSH